MHACAKRLPAWFLRSAHHLKPGVPSRGTPKGSGPGLQRLFRGRRPAIRSPGHHSLPGPMAALLMVLPGAYASDHTAAASGWLIVPETEDTHISVRGEAIRSTGEGIPPSGGPGIGAGRPSRRGDGATAGPPPPARPASGLTWWRWWRRGTPRASNASHAGEAGRGLPRSGTARVLAWPAEPPAWSDGGSTQPWSPGPAADRAGRVAGATGQLHRARVRRRLGSGEFDLCDRSRSRSSSTTGSGTFGRRPRRGRDIQRREWMDADGLADHRRHSDGRLHRSRRDASRRVRDALVERGCPGLPSRTPAAWNRQPP